jgi:multidrug transporter EmrE-like cation transporter
MLKYLILAVSIILNALANIFIKAGMNKISKQGAEGLKAIAFKWISNPFIILGLISFASALACYSYVLSKINVSIAYPVNTSLGIIIVIAISALFLGEKISLTQGMGFILIMAGVWLVAK